jgi:hypothetical protein
MREGANNYFDNGEEDDYNDNPDEGGFYWK